MAPGLRAESNTPRWPGYFRRLAVSVESPLALQTRSFPWRPRAPDRPSNATGTTQRGRPARSSNAKERNGTRKWSEGGKKVTFEFTSKISYGNQEKAGHRWHHWQEPALRGGERKIMQENDQTKKCKNSFRGSGLRMLLACCVQDA